MTDTKLKLQIIEADSDLSRIMIGESFFNEDIWDLRPFIESKSIKESSKYVKFDKIESAEMKKTVKLYAYYKLSNIKPQSVCECVSGRFSAFRDYCAINGIRSFKEITQEIFLNFNLWMKYERKYNLNTGYKRCYVVQEIIDVGQIKGWSVPQENVLRGITSYQLWPYKKEMKKRKTKPIPEDVFDRIMYHAVHDEKDILTKAGIIIQSQTGLRISEVLSVEEGCIKRTSDGYEYMEVIIEKTEPEPAVHKVFINDLVKDAIAELSATTKDLRKDSEFKELFLHKVSQKYNQICVPGAGRWSSNKLKTFIERWNICDNKGELYHLASHQFRATFVRELIKKKVPIEIIFKQFDHISVEMTSHYLTLEQEEIKEIYSDIIFGPESKIAGFKANEIKGKLDDLFRGKTQDEIDEAISGLSKTMSFNPLPTGVCLYDFRRGSCADGDGCFMYNCQNFITEVQFYPVLKAELDLLEKEMVRLKALEHEREWQKQYVKYKYLKPLVECLEVKMNGEETVD